MLSQRSGRAVQGSSMRWQEGPRAHAPVLVCGRGAGVGAAALLLGDSAQQAAPPKLGLNDHPVAQPAACRGAMVGRDCGRCFPGPRKYPPKQAERGAGHAADAMQTGAADTATATAQQGGAASPGPMCSMGCPTATPPLPPSSASSTLPVPLAVAALAALAARAAAATAATAAADAGAAAAGEGFSL